MTEPHRLYVDIETSLMFAGFWQPGQQYVGTQQIIKEREVMVIGYAWDDDPAQAMTFDMENYDLLQRDDNADLSMLQRFSEIYSEADLIIGHNVKAFDIAVMRARLIKHRLPDFAPTLIDDSYKQLKGIGFSGKSLDYITQFLGIGQKEDHPLSLWMNIALHKSQEDLNKMVTYCLGDVLNNRKMYKTLQPYVKSSLNMAVFYGDNQRCPNCGAEDSLVIRGHRQNKLGKYTRYYCKDCGTYPTIGNNILKKVGTFPR